MVLREKTGLPAHCRRAHPAAEMGGEEEGHRGDRRQEGGVAQAAGWASHSEMGYPQASCGLTVWTPAFCRFPGVSRESSGWD